MQLWSRRKMRDISQWRTELCKQLRRSDGLQDYVDDAWSSSHDSIRKRELERLARLIADVELALTLLRQVAPTEPASSVAVLLSGYRLPHETLQNDLNWQAVQQARFYLIRHRGRRWERSLEEYTRLPESVRIYRLFGLNQVPCLIPSSTSPRRLEKYQQTLTRTPPHKEYSPKLATAGTWFCKVSQKEPSFVEIPIDIPTEVANLAPSPIVRFHRTREARNPPKTARWQDLQLAAQEMDQRLAESGHAPENYVDRLRRIALEQYDSEFDDFRDGEVLQLEQLVHIVGLLNVGKSTLLEILIYHLAKQGKHRCALIVNEVVTAVKLASLFRWGLGVEAVPVLGSDRVDQLTKVYQPLFQNVGQEINQGGVHPAWRWFSPVCPLLALVQAEEWWNFGQEPCHSLYQKGASPIDAKIDEDAEEQESDEKLTCPLYYKCPRHQLERDFATAVVWILTPSSFIHSRVPRQIAGSLIDNSIPEQVVGTRLTLAEAVYRECDVLFVDEADRVQVKFDEEFAPSQVLVDQSGTSFLNKLGLNLAKIYHSDRGSMVGDRFVAWISAHYHIQNATNRLYHLLLTQGHLVVWLGRNPFTGYSLFARIIYDLSRSPISETDTEAPRLTRQERMQERRQQILAAALSPDQEHARRKALIKELQDFLRSPLNCRQSRSIWSRSLSNLAFTVLNAETDRQALIEVENWCKTWLEQHQIAVQDEIFEQLTHHVHFAVLTAVLDNRLGFLVDHLTELSQSRIVDLHDLDQAIVHRPPRDYLPIVPEAPVGNILGFLYKCDRRNFKRSSKLEYFRYVGVGRTLLLRFPTLFAVDDWDGAHTVLISGTSYAPGSPSYHINVQPTVLLKSAQENSSARSGIHASEFFFTPMRRPTDGKFIQLSGLPVAQRRLAADQLVRAMCESPGKVSSFLAKCFQELAELERTNPEWWSDRQRLLIVVGSYDEADWVGEILRPLYRLEQIDEGVATLRRDNAPARAYSLRRGEISELRHTPSQIVIAPLMALERGHNILNAQKQAAIGAVLFLNRPMPIPDDWQFTVRQLNNWALTHE
jgi:hypothetical protein